MNKHPEETCGRLRATTHENIITHLRRMYTMPNRAYLIDTDGKGVELDIFLLVKKSSYRWKGGGWTFNVSCVYANVLNGVKKKPKQ